MGLFNFLKAEKDADSKAENTPVMLGAPAKGMFVPMDQVPDEVFSQGIMGVCCGVDPSEGKVYAPADGRISQLADTLHAVGMEAFGMEILIHVGVDTVEMGGYGFSNKVTAGQNVKKGDLLLTMDLDKISAAGHAATVIMAVTNSDDFASVEAVAAGELSPGADVLRVNR